MRNSVGDSVIPEGVRVHSQRRVPLRMESHGEAVATRGATG